MSTTFIYLIEDSHGLIKIGQSNNVQRRLNQLQTAHGFKLKLLATCIADKYLEKRLHKMFFYHKKRGEWFQCSTSIKRTIIEFIQERYPTTIYEQSLLET